MATQRFGIAGGPNKFDLMLAVFDNNTPHQRVVTFLLSDGNHHHFIVNGVEREDGSGRKWLIKGTQVTESGRLIGHMKGYYCTTNRRGWMELS